MPAMKILLEGDGAFPELADGNFQQGQIATIATLAGGMESGRTSVALLIKLPDGSHVLAQTSLRLFQMAAAAFTGKFGDETGNLAIVGQRADGSVEVAALDTDTDTDDDKDKN